MNQTSPHRFRRWWMIPVAIVVVLLAMPYVLAKTTLRDRLLNAIASSNDVTVQSRDASLGYFSPLALRGLQVRSTNDSTRIAIEEIRGERSWLGLLFSRPELGVFHIDRPAVEVMVTIKQRDEDNDDDAANDQPSQSKKKTLDPLQLPTLAAEIRGASLILRTAPDQPPPIQVDDFAIDLRIDRIDGKPTLIVDPGVVFDHQPITPQLCRQGLQLIAPLLSDEIEADGEFSLRLDQFIVPLANEKESAPSPQIRGVLQLHQANVGLRDTIASKIAGGIVQRLSGKPIDVAMAVARDVQVDFQVLDGRFHHQGLALLLPRDESSIEVISEGSIGLDETLDLQVTIRLPIKMLGDSDLARRLADDGILVGVGGTLDEPQVRLPERIEWVRSVIAMIGDRDEGDASAIETMPDDLPAAMTDVLGGLIERARERDEPILKEPLFPRLRGRLRDRFRTAEEVEEEPRPARREVDL